MIRLAVMAVAAAAILAACAATNQNPVITSTKAMDDGTVELIWKGSSGAQYEVISSTDPGAPEGEWKVEATIKGKSGKMVWVDEGASGTKAKFYRIRKVLPPEKL